MKTVTLFLALAVVSVAFVQGEPSRPRPQQVPPRPPHPRLRRDTEAEEYVADDSDQLEFVPRHRQPVPRIVREANAEPSRPNRPIYFPTPRPPHPRLRREADAEPSRPFNVNRPNRPIYVPPPRPPHPRLRREADAEPSRPFNVNRPNRPIYVPRPRPPHPRL